MSLRFSYIKYDDQSMAAQQKLKGMFEAVEAEVEKLSEGRAKALVMTHLEIAYMWAGKAIRDEQIKRTGDSTEQKERGAE